MKVSQLLFFSLTLSAAASNARACHLRYGTGVQEPRHDLAHLVCELQYGFVSRIGHPPVIVSPHGGPQSLRPGVLELQPLGHLYIGHVRIGNRCSSAVYVESSLGQWPIEALVAFTRGDDDVWLAVHEATGLVGTNLASGEGGRIGSG